MAAAGKILAADYHHLEGRLMQHSSPYLGTYLYVLTFNISLVLHEMRLYVRVKLSARRGAPVNQ